MNDNKLDKARALYYGMFSRCFVFTTNNKRYFELINIIDILKENPLDKNSAKAFEEIRKMLKSDSNVEFMQEFDLIFHSPETEVIRTTASYFDEGFESGKKRVEMQNFLAKTKIRRNEKSYSDYEDHIGFIFSVMSELCELISNGEDEYRNTAHCIFEQILNDFVDIFSKNLYEHESSVIFKNVVILLKSFIEFERVYLEVKTPPLKQITTKKQDEDFTENLTKEEIERRARNKILRQSGPKQEETACPVNVMSEVENGI